MTGVLRGASLLAPVLLLGVLVSVLEALRSLPLLGLGACGLEMAKRPAGPPMAPAITRGRGPGTAFAFDSPASDQAVICRSLLCMADDNIGSWAESLPP